MIFEPGTFSLHKKQIIYSHSENVGEVHYTHSVSLSTPFPSIWRGTMLFLCMDWHSRVDGEHLGLLLTINARMLD